VRRKSTANLLGVSALTDQSTNVDCSDATDRCVSFSHRRERRVAVVTLPLVPRRASALSIAALCLAVGMAACGQSGSNLGSSPAIGRKGDQAQAAQQLGFPQFATKNTTRVGGADPTADAAAVAQAVFTPALSSARPHAVTLVDSADWQSGVAASVFMAPPLRAPPLLSGASLPDATKNALAALDPPGARQIGGAQVIRVGSVAVPSGLRSRQVPGGNPFAVAEAVDRLAARAAGKPADAVVVASGERAEFAMPAAAWAAKSGDPVLFVTRNAIPPETRRALAFHQQPKIYVLGPPNVISAAVEKALRKYGTVRRVSGPDAVTNAVAFARYSDGTFGWNVVDPGHGLVVANDQRPLDAAAGAPLSASGKYGPLLLVDQSSPLPPALIQYLLDIEPGYEKDPVRGVYNHGWLLGDAGAISIGDQARIDTLLEIAPVNTSQTQTTPSKPKPSGVKGKGKTSTSTTPTSTTRTTTTTRTR
jgi:ell wall binding domain 2 (CWB2)